MDRPHHRPPRQTREGIIRQPTYAASRDDGMGGAGGWRDDAMMRRGGAEVGGNFIRRVL